MNRKRNLLIGLVVAVLFVCAADLAELSARAELRAIEREQAALNVAHGEWAATLRSVRAIPVPGGK